MAKAFQANYVGDRAFVIAPTDQYPLHASFRHVAGEEVETERADEGLEYELVDHYETGNEPLWNDGEPIVGRDYVLSPFWLRHARGHDPCDEPTANRASWEEFIFPTAKMASEFNFRSPYSSVSSRIVAGVRMSMHKSHPVFYKWVGS